MIYLTIILLSLMSVGLTFCGIVLWKRRKETSDYSRYIQSIFSIVSAVFAFLFIFRTWNGTTTADTAYFEPEHTFIPLLIQTTFFYIHWKSSDPQPLVPSSILFCLDHCSCWLSSDCVAVSNIRLSKPMTIFGNTWQNPMSGFVCSR